MKKEVIVADKVHKGFVHAIKTGDTIYVMGQGPIDENGNIVGSGDVVVQTECAIENVRQILEAAGADLRDVVNQTIYIKHFEDRYKVVRALGKKFGGHQAPGALVVVDSLFDETVLIEIQCVAVV
ncbi:RidA family protein [Chloroflexota bacterium]